jgi:putative protease
VRTYDFIGIVKSYDPETGIATIEQRNHFKIGDKIEIIGPNYFYAEHTIEAMFDDKGDPIEVAPHAQQTVKLPLNQPVEPFYILRIEAASK